jgi:hypothetical protein
MRVARHAMKVDSSTTGAPVRPVKWRQAESLMPIFKSRTLGSVGTKHQQHVKGPVMQPVGRDGGVRQAMGGITGAATT